VADLKYYRFIDCLSLFWYFSAMNFNAGDTIVPADFPELKMLAWNRDPARPINADEAFALYERNWRFVDQGNLTTKESLLIQQLTQAFGHGMLLS